MDMAAGRTDEALHAPEHLLRRSPRERQQQHSLGTRAVLDQVRHAMDQRSRFSRTRARDDQQRATFVGGRFLLFLVELVRGFSQGCNMLRA